MYIYLKEIIFFFVFFIYFLFSYSLDYIFVVTLQISFQTVLEQVAAGRDLNL